MKISRKLIVWLRGSRAEEGQAMVLMAFAMVVILGFAAFAIDLGHVTVEKSNLQNAADAAALAGAIDLPNTVIAANTAVAYARDNGMMVTANNVTQNGDKVYAYAINSSQLKVECSRNVNYYFAGVLGVKSTQVTAVAVAQKSGSASGMTGLRPWALTDQYTYTYGLQFILKVGGGGGSTGYYGIVGFGTQNANSGSVYKDNITNGYDGMVNLGDYVKDGSGNVNVKNVINSLMTQSGDTTGDYTKAVDGDSRIVIIPKINAQTKQVIGFAAIYLKSVDNQGYITANFLYDTTWSQDQQDSHDGWGLKSNVKLMQ